MDLYCVKQEKSAGHVENSSVSYDFYKLSHPLHSQSFPPSYKSTLTCAKV